MAAQQILDIPEKQTSITVQQPMTPMDLLSTALTHNAAIDVIERLAALQEKALAKDAEMQFNRAMNCAQSELGRIAPDLQNVQTRSKYASYAALDRKIRPVYARHGFSLSFDTDDSIPETVKVLCYVSHRDGHSRTYRIVMPADGKGAKGGEVMSKTHATGGATAYGMRYLLKMIFNIAVGEEDADGNSGATNGWLAKHLDLIHDCAAEDLNEIYKTAFKEARTMKSGAAMLAVSEAYDKRKASGQ